MSGPLLFLGLVSLQRLAELFLARRNTIRLQRRGAVEYGASHYPFIVGLHAAWLAGLWLLAPVAIVHPIFVWLYLVLQGFRLWILVSLGERWTTRILVPPGEPLIKTGPYRFLDHPNYWLVALELLVVPLAFGLFVYAGIFLIANAIVMAVRIRVENQALVP
jgi:methyltransferase